MAEHLHHGPPDKESWQTLFGAKRYGSARAEGCARARARSAAMLVEQLQQRVHGLGGRHAKPVASRGAHHGAASRVVLQALAALEVLPASKS